MKVEAIKAIWTCLFHASFFFSTEIREAFKVFDRDGNGFISKQELGMAMRSLGYMPNEVELEVIIQRLDMDGTSHTLSATHYPHMSSVVTCLHFCLSHQVMGRLALRNLSRCWVPNCLLLECLISSMEQTLILSFGRYTTKGNYAYLKSLFVAQLMCQILFTLHPFGFIFTNIVSVGDWLHLNDNSFLLKSRPSSVHRMLQQRLCLLSSQYSLEVTSWRKWLSFVLWGAFQWELLNHHRFLKGNVCSAAKCWPAAFLQPWGVLRQRFFSS